MAERFQRYSILAIILHWTIAVAILIQLMLAWRMHGALTPERFAVFQLHKSVGVTILALSVLRLAWRLGHSPPALPDTLAGWERVLARLTHVFFYVFMIGMPISGWVMVSASPLAIPTRLYGAIPFPHLPIPRGDPWSEAGETIHLALAVGFLLLLPLHIAGALKHQLFSRDEPVLARMAPGAVAGRWLEPRLWLILAGAVCALAVGLVVSPPPPGVRAPQTPASLQAGWVPGAEPTLADPVVWKVEGQPPIRFTTTWSGQPVTGGFSRWQADIRFSPQALDRSRVRVSIDLTSATTGDAMRDTALVGQDWLDTATHPMAEFVAERFEQIGPASYVAHGRLSLRGTTRPLDLPFDLSFADPAVRMAGHAGVDRTAFGIGQRQFKATDQTPANVRIDFAFVARRD